MITANKVTLGEILSHRDELCTETLAGGHSKKKDTIKFLEVTVTINGDVVYTTSLDDGTHYPFIHIADAIIKYNEL